MEQHCQTHRRSCASTQEITPFISSCIGESGSGSGGNGRSVSPEVWWRRTAILWPFHTITTFQVFFIYFMCDFIIFSLDNFISAHPDTTASDRSYRVNLFAPFYWIAEKWSCKPSSDNETFSSPRVCEKSQHNFLFYLYWSVCSFRASKVESYSICVFFMTAQHIAMHINGSVIILIKWSSKRINLFSKYVSELETYAYITSDDRFENQWVFFYQKASFKGVCVCVSVWLLN